MNMNRVLYEASSKYEFLIFIPFVVMFLIAMFLFIRYKLNDHENLHNNKVFKRFMRGFVYLAIFSILGLFGQIHMYNKIVKAYEQGNYQLIKNHEYQRRPVMHV